MKNNFDLALGFVLQFEGGYVNDPDDLGGETCFGITRKNYPNLEMWKIIDELKKTTPQNKIGKIAYENKKIRESVQSVYKNKYWTPCKCDELDKPLDLFVFDASVNHGTKNAIKMLQQLVGAAQDGIIGKQTLQYTQNFTGDPYRYLEIRRTFYNNIIRKNPNQKKFKNGWFARLDKLYKA